jgi:thiol-disulfide isomerase/thioredoxin
LFLLIALGSLGWTGPSSAACEIYEGTLDPQPIPSSEAMAVQALTSIKRGDTILKHIAIPPKQRVFFGILHPASGQLSVLVLLVEPSSGPPFLLADSNLDGILTPDERHEFSSRGTNDSFATAVKLSLPYKYGNFTTLPLLIGLPKPDEIPNPGENRRFIMYSAEAYLAGSVNIAGKLVRVQYQIDLATGTVDPKRGWLGMDCDGDGIIDMEPGSTECDFSTGQPIIFHAAANYLSTELVDVSTLKINLLSHLPTEYRRIELTPGISIPDFPFVDFDGRTRKLSDFRGQVLLLDFWATWCGPCVSEMQDLRKIYQAFHPRGFEIIGINGDDDISQAVALVAEKKLDWPQATKRSTKQLTLDQFRIYSWPMHVLVDGMGRIISAGLRGQKAISVKHLYKTLQGVGTNQRILSPR